VLAFVLTFAAFSIADAQPAPQRKQAPKAATGASSQKLQADEKIVSELKRVKRTAYRNPGLDPVVRSTELECAFPNQITLDQREIRALWGDGHKGEYDRCAEKPRLPISQRMTQRFYQLLGGADESALKQALDNLASARFDRRDYLSARPGQVLRGRQTDIRMYSGSDALGSVTDYPATPVNFTLHALLLDAVQPNGGYYSGRDVRVAITTGFTLDDGTPVRPCVNFAGEFGRMPPPQASAAPAPPPEKREEAKPPEAPTTYDAVILKVHRDRKGRDVPLEKVKGWKDERFIAAEGYSRTVAVNLNDRSEIVVPGVKFGSQLTIDEHEWAPGYRPLRNALQMKAVTFEDGQFLYGGVRLPPDAIQQGRIIMLESFINKQNDKAWLARSCIGPIPRWACFAGAAVGTGLIISHHHGKPASAPTNNTQSKDPPVGPPTVRP
jgi:hypothetical protein